MALIKTSILLLDEYRVWNNRMTLTEQIREQASDAVSQFNIQDELSANLPNALKNMLQEFSKREGVPDLTLSARRIRLICDHHDGMGSYSLNIDTRLTEEISDYPFRARYEDDIEIEVLEYITEDEDTSLPIVEVSTKYFDSCVGYTVQQDSGRKKRSHYLVVMAINHATVLVYDPMNSYFNHGEDGSMKPTEVDKQSFLQAWLGDFEITNTLWIEQTDQKRIAQFDNES